MSWMELNVMLHPSIIYEYLKLIIGMLKLPELI